MKELNIVVISGFNPRAREGRDPYGKEVPAQPAGFNPRAREGRDIIANGNSNIIATVSIHAPVKGATSKGIQNPQGDLVSIHAPVKGATYKKNAAENGTACFNPRAREGRDGGR